MRNSLQQQYVARHTTSESFGRIARCTASATRVQLAGRPSANEADIASRSAFEPMSWRAFAAGGFGDAALARTGDPGHLSATQLEAAARNDRSRRIEELAVAAWRAVANRLQRWVTRAKQRQLARATYLALRELDTRTLRDIGFDRSEILSVVAEIAGAADSTRAHVVLTLNGRLC